MDVFCKIINGEMPSIKCYENDKIMIIMDAYPYTPGHVLIIPKAHYTTLFDMDDEIMGEIHRAMKEYIKKIEERYPGVTGVKVVVNYGSEQKVKHYHMHLLPIYDNGKPDMTQEEFCEILKR